MGKISLTGHLQQMEQYGQQVRIRHRQRQFLLQDIQHGRRTFRVYVIHVKPLGKRLLILITNHFEEIQMSEKVFKYIFV